MSQEDGVLIDIEKQTMEQQENDLEMKPQQSRQSISRAKVFSPTNADNLADRLRLSRSKWKNRGKDTLKCSRQEHDEESGVQKSLQYSKSFEGIELIKRIQCILIKYLKIMNPITSIVNLSIMCQNYCSNYII